MEKVCFMRVLGSRVNDEETNSLLVCKGMIILKYNTMLSNYFVIIVFIRMSVEAEDTTLVLKSNNHNMADQLTNPAHNPLVGMKFMD